MATLKVKNLRKIMDVKGWSQSDLARLTGCHRSYISYLLRGMRRPSADFILALGRILPGFETEEFFLPEVLTKANDEYEYGTEANTQEASHA